MNSSDPTGVTWLVGKIRPEAVELVRSDIASSTQEVIREIHRRLPPRTGPDGERPLVELCVQHALQHYLDLLDRRLGTARPRPVRSGERHHLPARPARRAPDWREFYRGVGARQVRSPQGLDVVHSAIRTGARVAVRRLQFLAEREHLSANAIAMLTEAVFDNADDLADAVAEGYAEARGATSEQLDRRRQRLLDVLISEPPASESAVAEAAAAAGWHVPHRVAAIAVVATDDDAGPPVLSPNILARFDEAEPFLVVPDPTGLAQVRAVVNGLARFRVAVGPAVAPVDAGKSLRWARQALDLAAQKLIPDEQIIWCARHLATIALFQDPDLLSALAQQRLAPLAHLRPAQREMLATTLLWWLKLNMNTNVTADHLHVHPQTIRRRLRVLRQYFGAELWDPDLRFELEVALRSEWTGKIG